MSSISLKSRSFLVAAVKQNIIPELHVRGFTELPQHKDSIPMWHLNRLRPDGGYDVISICFDKKRRPAFDAIINIVDHAGITSPRGEIIPPQAVVAAMLLKRVYIQKKRRGVLAMLFKKWLSHDFFGFEPSEDAAKNTKAANQICAEFINCLDQAERWWKTRELGPNLIETNIGAVLRDPNGAVGASSVDLHDRK